MRLREAQRLLAEWEADAPIRELKWYAALTALGVVVCFWLCALYDYLWPNDLRGDRCLDVQRHRELHQNERIRQRVLREGGSKTDELVAVDEEKEYRELDRRIRLRVAETMFHDPILIAQNAEEFWREATRYRRFQRGPDGLFHVALDYDNDDLYKFWVFAEAKLGDLQHYTRMKLLQEMLRMFLAYSKQVNLTPENLNIGRALVKEFAEQHPIHDAPLTFQGFH